MLMLASPSSEAPSVAAQAQMLRMLGVPAAAMRARFLHSHRSAALALLAHAGAAISKLALATQGGATAGGSDEDSGGERGVALGELLEGLSRNLLPLLGQVRLVAGPMRRAHAVCIGACSAWYVDACRMQLHARLAQTRGSPE